MNRVEVLKSMLANDPDNSFARYGLAQELLKSGDYKGAIAEFATVMEKDPKYQASYYHCGQAYEKLGDVDRAKEIYHQGIEVAMQNGDSHAESELRVALDALG